MIECFDFATSYRFEDALASQFRLRHRVFVERNSYGVPTWKGMEYDQYDTPATAYLVWRDEDHVVRGVARLNPTDRPYMLKDVWPDMVTAIPLPQSPTVWEGSRFGVDRDQPVRLRQRIVRELVIGYLEFGLSEGIKHIIGVMPPLIWRAVFGSNGWAFEPLGEPWLCGSDKCVAGRLPVSAVVLAQVRAKTGIVHSVLERGDRADMIGRRHVA